MRAVTSCTISCLLAAGLWATPPVGGRAAAATDEKPRKEAKAGRSTSAPAVGVKTPGVRIPFASVKAEAQVSAPAKPKWAFFSDSVFLPGAEGLDRIDSKTNKLAEPIAGLKQPCGGMVSAF